MNKIAKGVLTAVITTTIAVPLIMSRISVETVENESSSQQINTAASSGFIPSPSALYLPENITCIYGADSMVPIDVDVMKVSSPDLNYTSLEESNRPTMQITSMDAIMSEAELYIPDDMISLTQKVYKDLRKNNNLSEYLSMFTIENKDSDIDFANYIVLDMYTLTANRKLNELTRGLSITITMDTPQSMDGEEIVMILIESENHCVQLQPAIVTNGQITFNTRPSGVLLLIKKPTV